MKEPTCYRHPAPPGVSLAPTGIRQPANRYTKAPESSGFFLPLASWAGARIMGYGKIGEWKTKGQNEFRPLNQTEKFSAIPMDSIAMAAARGNVKGTLRMQSTGAA